MTSEHPAPIALFRFADNERNRANPMPRTRSILTETQWKINFGKLLKDVSEYQHIAQKEVAAGIDQGAGGKRRYADVWRYMKGKRIPSPAAVDQLATVLRLPPLILQLAAGHIDRMLNALHYVATCKPGAFQWSFVVEPRRAALAVLFGLFPNRRMHVGWYTGLIGFLHGNVTRLNLTETEGFQTGPGWNAVWLYPYQMTASLLTEHKYEAQGLTVVNATAQRRRPASRIRKNKSSQGLHGPFILALTDAQGKPQKSYFSAAAVAQVDIASEIATAIYAMNHPPSIPNSSIMGEVVHVLHAKSIPLNTRVENAVDYVHLWADELDKSLAHEVRQSLHPWEERTLSVEGASWIRGVLKKKPPTIWE